MKATLAVLLLAGLLLPGADRDPAPGEGGLLEVLPSDLEIELALSALPPHLRADATVYILDPDAGFEIARAGDNGFHTFVARTNPDAFFGSWEFTEYPDDLLIPISFDAEGSKSAMRRFFDTAELQAEGLPAAETKIAMLQRMEAGEYPPPERAGVSYMLSPVLRAYLNPYDSDRVGTFNFPHYMFYAPHISNEDIGGGVQAGEYPFVFRPGDHGYIILRAGVQEITEINQEHEAMLTRLCEIRASWCLPEGS